MPSHPDTFETLTHEDLTTTTGGLDIGSLVGNIAGAVDKYAGTGGKATEVANGVMGIVNSFAGGGER